MIWFPFAKKKSSSYGMYHIKIKRIGIGQRHIELFCKIINLLNTISKPPKLPSYQLVSA